MPTGAAASLGRLLRATDARAAQTAVRRNFVPEISFGGGLTIDVTARKRGVVRQAANVVNLLNQAAPTFSPAMVEGLRLSLDVQQMLNLKCIACSRASTNIRPDAKWPAIGQPLEGSIWHAKHAAGIRHLNGPRSPQPGNCFPADMGLDLAQAWTLQTKNPRRTSPARAKPRQFLCLLRKETETYFSELLTEVNLSFRFDPRPLTTAMIANAIPAAIRPYSIAVAPDSSDKKLNKVRFNAASCGS